MITMARLQFFTWKTKFRWVSNVFIAAALMVAVVPTTPTKHGFALPVEISGREPSIVFCSAMIPYLEQHGSFKAALVCSAVMDGSSTTLKAPIATY